MGTIYAGVGAFVVLLPKLKSMAVYLASVCSFPKLISMSDCLSFSLNSLSYL